jgi:hypothetical protein
MESWHEASIVNKTAPVMSLFSAMNDLIMMF